MVEPNWENTTYFLVSRQEMSTLCHGPFLWEVLPYCSPHSLGSQPSVTLRGNRVYNLVVTQMKCSLVTVEIIDQLTNERERERERERECTVHLTCKCFRVSTCISSTLDHQRTILGPLLETALVCVCPSLSPQFLLQMCSLPRRAPWLTRAKQADMFKAPKQLETPKKKRGQFSLDELLQVSALRKSKEDSVSISADMQMFVSHGCSELKCIPSKLPSRSLKSPCPSKHGYIWREGL